MAREESAMESLSREQPPVLASGALPFQPAARFSPPLSAAVPGYAAAPSSVSATPTPLFLSRPAGLWSATARLRSLSGERPKPERDSLRSRSVEGRPGTRKNKRWEHSRAIVTSLRRAMAACGEDGANPDVESLAAAERGVANRPSAFYRLIQHEGPEFALDALSAAESSRVRHSSRERRPPTVEAAAAQHEQAVRRAFSDSLPLIRKNEGTRNLLSKLESEASRAFATPHKLIEDSSWQLNWDGDSEALDTMSGEPPAGEMEVYGLSAIERKIVHQLARVLGLHSESRSLEGLLAEVGEGDGKSLAIRPPRRLSAWTAPFCVARVLAVA